MDFFRISFQCPGSWESLFYLRVSLKPEMLAVVVEVGKSLSFPASFCHMELKKKKCKDHEILGLMFWQKYLRFT